MNSFDRTQHGWRSIAAIQSVFHANLKALRSRDASLADRLGALTPPPVYLREHRGTLQLAAQSETGLRVLPNPVTPQTANEATQRLCAADGYGTPALVAGIDQGWLWSALYGAPIRSGAIPGYRPPIYFLAHDLERLRIAMHLHDWRTLLADTRAQIFAGHDAIGQLRAALLDNPRLSWPRLSVTVENQIWAPGESLDSFLRSINTEVGGRLETLRGGNDAYSAALSAVELARRLRRQRLRVLGITSRYTTFLQHSMRDWLNAFERLGHQTRLVIETGDHEMLNNVVYTEAIAQFRPDLVVIIDHYRAELASIPQNIPCVMWVQDQLPNITSTSAGAAQTSRDYCLGFGRLHLSRSFGYPASRYMPATVGVNEERFAPAPLLPVEREKYACDVSFVTHASAPADRIVHEQMKQLSPEAARLVGDVFDRLRAVYEAGDSLTQPILLRRLIEQSMSETQTTADAQAVRQLTDFFQQRVNNALFRHQAVEWLVESGVDLRLYGNGWASHPRYRPFARGPASNQTELSAIFRASRINLQATPHGAVHQRLFEGLAAGAFFLIRQCPGDLIETPYRALRDWCSANSISSTDDLKHRATPEINALLREIETLLGISPFDPEYPLLEALELSADGQYTRSAGAIWAEYGEAAFDSRQQLHERLQHFLSDEGERCRIAASMRNVVLDRFTYLSTTRRLLQFIADDLDRGLDQQSQVLEAAA